MRLVLSQGHGRRWLASEIPNAVALPDVPTIAAYGFDLAVELLAAQKISLWRWRRR
jgi:hypothetical protein